MVILMQTLMGEAGSPKHFQVHLPFSVQALPAFPSGRKPRNPADSKQARRESRHPSCDLFLSPLCLFSMEVWAKLHHPGSVQRVFLHAHSVSGYRQLFRCLIKHHFLQGTCWNWVEWVDPLYVALEQTLRFCLLCGPLQLVHTVLWKTLHTSFPTPYPVLPPSSMELIAVE